MTENKDGKEKKDWNKELADRLVDEMVKQMNEDARINLLPKEEKKRAIEERIELDKRSHELFKKQMKRDTISLFSLLGMLFGSMAILILTMITLLLSMVTMMDLFIKNPNDFNYISGFETFTLDQYYLTWIIPTIIFTIGYVNYRKVKPRNEKDFFREVGERTLEKLK